MLTQLLEQQRLGFAHIMVEVNLNSDFPREVELDMGAGERITIGNEYPWIPQNVKPVTCLDMLLLLVQSRKRKSRHRRDKWR